MQPWEKNWTITEEIKCDDSPLGDLSLGAHVFRVASVVDNTPAILKTVPDGSNDPSHRDYRCRRLDVATEIVALQHLHGMGASVPAVLDHNLYSADAKPFVVMEYIDGVTLQQSCKLTSEQGDEIEAILMAAHQAGITHRNVLPCSVLLRHDGRVVLIDWAAGLHMGVHPVKLRQRDVHHFQRSVTTDLAAVASLRRRFQGG